jgi:hypothetical protein
VSSTRPLRLLASTILGACAPASAHHGVAPHYDTSKSVHLEGVVTKFDFINPHSFVYIEVAGAQGATEIWTCEMASRTVLARNGLSADTFKIGERIELDGVAARHKATGCAFRTAYLSDGRVLDSTEYFAPTLADANPGAADRSTIFGVWTMKRFAVSRYEGVLTEAGERARAAFDPVRDDPAIYCDPASPVRFWVNVNEPFEIRRDENTVVIAHRFMDYSRIVHLDAPAPGPAVPRSTMGYSTGRFDGKALIVDTTRFAAATLEPRYGVMHTENLKLTERLEVNEATGELQITWTIDDPEFFKEPHTQTELFVRSPWDAEPYDCKPGYQQ